jgi:DNA-binding transcriptional MerR regulator
MKFSIGELEKLTGMNRTALRYYDAEGLIDPERQENGYRLYSDEDVMSLIQLKQMSAFGIELSEMPGSARNVGIKDVCLSLVRKEQIIEQEIEELYQKLARLRLHAEAYKTCAEGNSEVTESRTVGAYRLYLRENDPDSAKTARIGISPTNSTDRTISTAPHILLLRVCLIIRMFFPLLQLYFTNLLLSVQFVVSQ